ncbi:ATP-dependent DNA helicase yku80 [Lithohypha guttulata]|uniref:ATP-dependent DNA helicase yku80 n=1 Tax=Lithohypha guttulata TaxID=1690604 RepID=UPI002DDEEE42|nr:ATP-dependent DNA helicase yku80 [Lithohypha guttulata]
MAEKEASIFIIDVGKSMSRVREGRQESDLDYCLQYVWDKLANIVYTGRKGLVVGVIGLRTDKTNNHMQEEGGYEHITVIQSIQQILMPELQSLPNYLKTSSTDTGDALSAVILGVDLLMKHCRTLKFTKRLYLITNGTGKLDPDDIEEVAAQIKQNDIKLTILGVDFDDPEYGFKEENKPFQKQQNEEALKKLVELSDGVYGVMDEAIEGLQRPFVKEVKPITSYKGQLRLGDPEKYDTAITIDIERYPKVMIRKPPSASSYVQRDAAPIQQQEDGADPLTNVRAAYSYQIKDEDAPGGFRDVPREELAKGYEYGRTAVHISESDENITKLDTHQSYEILGFIPAENVERYMFLGVTNILVAQKLNDKAAYALSSLARALFEVGSVAVARFVKKDMAEPMLTCLSPLIDDTIECLVENDLPYAEDLRIYRFPPLDKVLTVSGKTLASHRNLPSDDTMEAMSDFIDNMSLINPDTKEELFAIEDVYSPLLHTIESAIKYRAVHPDGTLPPKSGILLEPSQPPKDLQAQSQKSLARLIKAADVKKVPPKVKGRARYRDRESDKPLSGLDVDALLKKPGADRSGPRKTITIDPQNAIPEFKRFFSAPDDDALVKEAVVQMGKIIEDKVRTSLGDSNYDLAIEMLGVVRQEMLELEFSELYNEMMHSLKGKIVKEELGGDRREFWWKVRVLKMGLIDSEQSENSTVSKEDAAKFLRLRES